MLQPLCNSIRHTDPYREMHEVSSGWVGEGGMGAGAGELAFAAFLLDNHVFF